MTDENGINPENLQPEDTVKPKRVRKPKVEKTEEPAVEAKEETIEAGWQYTYNHPEYDMYKAYQKYFEEQSKTVLDYWTAVMKNLWNPWK